MLLLIGSVLDCVLVGRQVGPVDVAPSPRLTRFNGSNQWMARFIMVTLRVLRPRTIAASWLTADHAHPDVNPLGSVGHALRADGFRRLRDHCFVEVTACASSEGPLEDYSAYAVHSLSNLIDPPCADNRRVSKLAAQGALVDRDRAD